MALTFSRLCQLGPGDMSMEYFVYRPMLETCLDDVGVQFSLALHPDYLELCYFPVQGLLGLRNMSVECLIFRSTFLDHVRIMVSIAQLQIWDFQE